MMSKKITCVTLAALVSMSIMAGCKKAEKQADSKAAAEVANMNPTGLPIAKDKVTLKMVGVLGVTSNNFKDMPFFQKLEERTNVHIEWELYPGTTYNDKKNILLAANELPDAFFGPNSFTMDDANKFGPQGTVIPLDDLIDKYAPNYKEVLKKSPLVNGLSTAFDGKKYTMGTVSEADTRNYPDQLFINKKWLDNLGLKVPTTIEEYYNVLKAFKDQDPNKNGKKDEIPFTFVNFNHINGYGSFFGAFGRVDAHNFNGSPLDHFVVENGKVVFTADKPEYKTAINYLSKFFKEGLFDKEGFTQDPKQYQAKLQDPIGVVGSYYAFNTTAAPERVGDYICIAPLKGPNGQEPVVKKRLNNINFQGSGFAITSINKNKEITMRWVDEFYTVKNSIEAQSGVPGTTGAAVKDRGDGTYEIIQGVDAAKYAPGDEAPKYVLQEYSGKYTFGGNNAKAENIAKYYSVAKASETLPSMNFKPEEIKFNTSSGLDIGNYVKDRQAKWLLEGNIDAEWDAYIAKLKQLKLDEFVKQMQTVYDRTVVKK